MAKKEPTLLESAMRGLRASKHGRVIQVVADGNGAFVTMDIDFNTANKWAFSKTSSGSPQNDRNKFMDQFATLIARPGSFVNTRGGSKPILDIAKLMKSAGFDLNDWALPPDVKAEFSHGPEPTKPKPKTDDAGEKKEP